MTEKRWAAPAGAALVWAAAADPAAACTTCAQGIRRQVWAEVFGPDFAANLLVTALPFAAFALTAAAVHGFRGPRR